MNTFATKCFFFALICGSNGLSNYSFPDDFSFGAGSSAYQTEGAMDENKGETIWDYAIKKNSSIISDGSNATIADNAYYVNFEEDAKALNAMNLSHYRISVAWSRVFPEGIYSNDTDVIVGLGHYQHQVNYLLSYNITPIVTLYHWDLPEVIQEWGGWTNESNIDIFVQYADYAFQYLYMVPYFITFNEPKQICKGGYGEGTLAPFIKDSGVSDYICAKNILKAHARVYKLYQEKYAKYGYNAKISIALDGSYSEPKTQTQNDLDAVDRRNQFEFELYLNPIINGVWPYYVNQRVIERSKKENLPKSRLPELRDDEIQLINGSIDFIALNYYDTRRVADAKEADYDKISYDNDMRVEVLDDKDHVDAAGNRIDPTGLRKFLKYVKRISYNTKAIFITANGYADDTGTLNDDDRIGVLSEYLSNVVDAIHEDEVNVIGYTYWSLLDSFEWTRGYKPHYGLLATNMKNYDYTRIQKKSVKYYRLLVANKKIPDPDSLTTTTSTPSISTTTTTTTTTTTVKPNSATINYISSIYLVFILLLNL